MPTGSSPASAAPRRATATSRAARARAAARTWSARRWRRRPRSKGISSTSAVSETREMEPFRIHTGLVAPLDRENVDTDAIIPKQFLKSIKRTGFGPHLFDAWRYLDVGEPGMDLSKRKPNPDFVLNNPKYQGASILLARKNFGCGSSREHAPWALQQYGFKAIVAPSFADIFFTNSFKNGFLPIVLTELEVDHLFNEVQAHAGYKVTIDLASQAVTTPSGKAM